MTGVQTCALPICSTAAAAVEQLKGELAAERAQQGEAGQEIGFEQIVTLFRARGPEVAAVLAVVGAGCVQSSA